MGAILNAPPDYVGGSEIVGDDLTVVDQLIVGGNASIGGTLGVTGAITATAALSVGTTLGVTGAATIGGTLGVTGAITATAALSVGTTLAVTGVSTFTGQARFADGSVTAPGAAFTLATGTGMWREPGTGSLVFSTAGVERLAFGGNVVALPSTAAITWAPTGTPSITAPDLSLQRGAADTLAQRRSGNAQAFLLAETDAGGADYSRLRLAAQAANDFLIAPEAGGTGTLRGLQLIGSGGRLGFFATTAVVKQTRGATLTNSVTSGGTDDTIANYTDLVIYANDAAAIRNDIYQLTRALRQHDVALRAYGLLT